MDRLLSMRVFRRVVDRASFAAAARDLRLSPAAVSKHVAALEEALGVRLLHRTTRRVATTTAGAAYHDHCARILDEIDDVDRALGSSAAAVSGTVRVGVPLSFALAQLGELFPEVSRRHPELTLEVDTTDRFVDLVAERADLVVRIAETLADSDSLVAHRLARAGHVLCASPAYLAERGAPESPDDLRGASTVSYGLSSRPGTWRLRGPRGPVDVSPRSRLVLGNSLAIRQAILRGAGVALLPIFYVDEDLRSGALVRVLPAYEGPVVGIHAVHPRGGQPPRKVRVVLDMLRAHLARAPWAQR